MTVSTIRLHPLAACCAVLLAACGNGNAVTPPAGERAADGLQVETVAGELAHPWGMAFLPDGGVLVTERPGRLRRVGPDGELSAPIAGVPAVHAQGQGGLLDVQLSPQFESDGLVYLSYSEPGEDGTAGTAVARGVLQGDRLRDVEVIFRQQPKVAANVHYGSRLVFGPDGNLFVTLGDRGQRPEAQELDSHIGTIVRIEPDGDVPADNPFVDREGALPEIWSYGHRNVQAAALNPWRNELWEAEHGPRGGDEINRPQPGENYGWPIVTHGINYSGEPIPEAVGESQPGMQPPLFVWETSPAVSGMAFYDADLFPQWKGSLLIGALAQRALIRLEVDGLEVSEQERLLQDVGRIRDVEVGPDGAVYVLTDEAPGRLLRLTPSPSR